MLRLIPARLVKSVIYNEELVAQFRQLFGQFADELERTLLRAFGSARDAVVIAHLRRALETNNISQVLSYIELVPLSALSADMQSRFAAGLRGALEHAGMLESSSLGKLLREPRVSFDALHPRVVDWMRENIATLITNETEQTKRHVRELVLDAWREGVPAPQLARRIREHIGLNARQARALENYRRRLIESGLKLDQVERKVARYRDKMLRYRARMIAETELNRAVNFAKNEMWRQAADKGFIDPNQTEREWIFAGVFDCPICAPVDGQKRRIGEPFSTPIGEVDAPPLHPNCMCIITLTRVNGRRVGRHVFAGGLPETAAAATAARPAPSMPPLERLVELKGRLREKRLMVERALLALARSGIRLDELIDEPIPMKLTEFWSGTLGKTTLYAKRQPQLEMRLSASMIRLQNEFSKYFWQDFLTERYRRQLSQHEFNSDNMVLWIVSHEFAHALTLSRFKQQLARGEMTSADVERAILAAAKKAYDKYAKVVGSVSAHSAKAEIRGEYDEWLAELTALGCTFSKFEHLLRILKEVLEELP